MKNLRIDIPPSLPSIMTKVTIEHEQLIKEYISSLWLKFIFSQEATAKQRRGSHSVRENFESSRYVKEWKFLSLIYYHAFSIIVYSKILKLQIFFSDVPWVISVIFVVVSHIYDVFLLQTGIEQQQLEFNLCTRVYYYPWG